MEAILPRVYFPSSYYMKCTRRRDFPVRAILPLKVEQCDLLAESVRLLSDNTIYRTIDASMLRMHPNLILRLLHASEVAFSIPFHCNAPYGVSYEAFYM